MCNASTARNSNFYVREFQSKICMNQFTIITMFIYTSQNKLFCSVPVSHHSVMCTHYSRKKTKTNNTLPVLMFQTFIINQSNFFINHYMYQLLIVWLFLFSVRKK